MVRKIAGKISFLFALGSSFLMLVIGIGSIFFFNYMIDYQAHQNLEAQLDITSDQFAEGDLKKVVTTNTYDSKDVRPSGDYEGKERLQEVQSQANTFSQVTSRTGEVLFSSDLFDILGSRRHSSGFNKIRNSSDDTCVYTLSGDVGGSVVQVGQFCPITPSQEKILYASVVVLSLFVSAASVLPILKISALILNPVKKDLNKAEVFVENSYHDLLTPITVAISSADKALMTKDYQKGLESVKSDLDLVYSTLDRLRGSSLNVYEKVNLLRLVKDLSKEAKRLYKRDDIRLLVDIDKSREISTVKESFESVLRNIIVNAFKFSKKDAEIRISFDGKIFAVSNECEADYLEGLDMEGIFERGVVGPPKVDKWKFETKWKNEGKGLGLFISKKLAEDLGFEIRARKDGNLFVLGLYHFVRPRRTSKDTA